MKILKGTENTAWASDDAYFANKSALSNSMLSILDDSPTKFKLFLDGKWEYPSASYFDIGSAVHELFLEDKDRRILVEGTRRTKEYKLAKEDNPSALVLPSSDYRLVDSMVDKLRKVPQVKQLMEFGDEFIPEMPVMSQVITDSGNFIDIRGKLDGVIKKGDDIIIMDLKTSGKGLSDWKRNAWWGSYPRQAYMYSQMVGAKDFYFCVITKEFPYDCGIYKASEKFLEKGKNHFEQSILEYERLFLNGEYESYGADVGQL